MEEGVEVWALDWLLCTGNPGVCYLSEIAYPWEGLLFRVSKAPDDKA